MNIGLDARGGIHRGPVVVRGDDLFGATVNLAARLAELAAPGHLAVTRQIALAAGTVDLAVTPHGSIGLRGFRDSTEVFELNPCRHRGEWLTDPICGMRLYTADAIARRREDKELIGFCSRRCAELFDRDARPD